MRKRQPPPSEVRSLSTSPDYSSEFEHPEQQQLSDLEILAVLQQELAASHGAALSSEIAERRAEALDAYLGAAYGDEEPGSSGVVMRDVLETIEWMMPDLVETFTAGDTIARFDPVGEEDEEEAKQQTDYTNHVFLVENKGFNIIHPWFKDALLKQGYVKWWWDVSRRADIEEYEQQSEEMIAQMLENDPELELVAAEPDPQVPGFFTVQIRRTYEQGRAVVCPVPGEEVRINREARSIDTARFMAHVPSDMTAGKLRELGYTQEQIDEIPSYTSQDSDAEAISRRQLEDASPDDNPRTDSERAVCYVESWVRIDIDGDGISELMKICAAGYGNSISTILHKESAPEIPFASLSPILVPHRQTGLGVAEIILELQRIHTAIARQYLNALYLGNNPRHTVERMSPGGPLKCDVDKLLQVVPGGVVPIDGPGVIQPLLTEDVAPKALTGLEWIRSVREERTGVNRYTQGMEAPELNTTATGLVALQGAANKRIKFIARIFAETGVRDLMRGLAGLLKRHQRVQKIIRLRGEWTPIDPSTWKHDYDCTIEVGLGYGDKTERVANLQTILALQEKAAAYGLANPEGVYEAVSELLKEMGYRNPERFFPDPKKGMAKPPPSVEEQKLAQDRELKLRELEVKELEIQLRYEVDMLKLTGIVPGEREPDEPRVS